MSGQHAMLRLIGSLSLQAAMSKKLVRQYMENNPLHVATGALMASGLYMGARTVLDRFHVVDSLVPPSLEAVIEERPRLPKSELSAPAAAAAAFSIDGLNAAIARCGYDEDGTPGEALARCVAVRVEHALRCDGKSLDFGDLLADVELVIDWAKGKPDEGKLLSRHLYIK